MLCVSARYILLLLAALHKTAVLGFSVPQVTRRYPHSIDNYHTRVSHHNSRLRMSVEGDFDPAIISRSVAEAKTGSLRAKVNALYKFTRPHTIRGTVLASIAGTIRALIDTPGAISNANWGVLLPRAIIGMVALLLGNAFIVGINQIFDEDIDKMNKPFLPVASGEMSKRFAWGAVLTGGIAGPLIV